jgi:hypothetical protein
MKALSVLAASALLVGATVSAHASPAISSFVFTIQQDGSNVDVTGSGNINLDGQTQDCTPPCTPLPSFMWSSAPGITTGATGAGVLVNEYAFSHSPTGPSNFGTGSLTNATTASGELRRR